ncbi:MAG: hypothetical protein V3V00_15185 [Saprospiraceae bacterium]
MRFIITISALLFSLFTIGQSDISNLFYLEGELYGGLPIQISVHTGAEISGYTKYGSNGELEYTIEGELTNAGYMLYEFDGDHILSGTIELSIDNKTGVWNSIDFNQNIPISFVKKPDHSTFDYSSHQSYFAVSYPVIDHIFDRMMGKKISVILREIAENYGIKEITNGPNTPNNRFIHRTIAINKVALNSDKIISGYLTFFDNQSVDVITLTYTYDKNKKEMLGLSKIFKKNFNYSFFLKQYINQKKEKMIPMLSSLELTWLKASPFHHYVLTESGLKFFSEYNAIFGRKSFTIPYHEVASSIGQKSITNYIKKRK